MVEVFSKEVRSVNKPTRGASTVSEDPAAQACDAKALRATLKEAQSTFKSFPADEGKITATGLKARIADMPGRLGDYFAGLERPVVPGDGAVGGLHHRYVREAA
jgi:hypothetical protein